MNLVNVAAGRVTFALPNQNDEYIVLRPHPWFVAIGDRRGNAVINTDQVTNNALRCFVESVQTSGGGTVLSLVIRTTCDITLV